MATESWDHESIREILRKENLWEEFINSILLLISIIYYVRPRRGEFRRLSKSQRLIEFT